MHNRAARNDNNNSGLSKYLIEIGHIHVKSRIIHKNTNKTYRTTFEVLDDVLHKLAILVLHH